MEEKIPKQFFSQLFEVRKRIAVGLSCKNVINREPYKEAHDGTQYKDGSPIRSPYATPLLFSQEKEIECDDILEKVHHSRAQMVIQHLPLGMIIHEHEKFINKCSGILNN